MRFDGLVDLVFIEEIEGDEMYFLWGWDFLEENLRMYV